MGTLHAGSVAGNARLCLAWVVDPDPGRAAALAEPLGARPGTMGEMLADESLAGVVVATSTDALLANSLACLEAGKAVFCEKPLSLSPAELRGAAGSLEGPLFVAFNRRFDPHLALLKQKLDSGAVGELEALHLINHDPAAPSLAFVPRSGGLFKDFTVHDFDTAAWLLGERIVEIFASASCLIDSEIGDLGDFDTAKLVLRTESGRLCMISNSRRSGYGYDQRIEAFGSKGALRVDNVQPSAVSRWTGEGERRSAFPYAFPDRYAEAYRGEMDHFADMIEHGERPRTGWRAALAALEFAEAAEQSARTGRSVRPRNRENENA